MKIVIIYTILMSSGMIIESELFTPTLKGRPIKTMEACQQYAMRSTQNMRYAYLKSTLFDDVSAVCKIVDKNRGM